MSQVSLVMSLGMSTPDRVALVAAALFVVWLGLAAATAEYGARRGYPFFPLFVASTFLGFPVVLLVVGIASRHLPEAVAAREAAREEALA
jgi:hypothetical protein